jgi:malonate decarboxylase epsilon subunit
MLHSLPDHPEIAGTLDEAGAILERDVLELDSPRALKSTVQVQLALLITGVSVSRALQSEGACPKAVAGLSVGAFSAAVAAGVLPFDAALRSVRLRGELMEGAYRQGYGMAAILGLSETEVSALVRKVHSPDSPLFVASINAPRQIVVSGAENALQRVAEHARLRGATRVERLHVSVPSHCELLEMEAELLRREMAEIELLPPKALYIDNRGGRELPSPESIREDLATNMAHPVRWHDALEVMYELGVRLFIELPPGRVLTGLIAAAYPDARAIACSETPIDSICLLARREAR